MSNPNNCETCDYSEYEHDGLHCYMFKDSPTDVCMQHTGRDSHLSIAAMGVVEIMLQAMFAAKPQPDQPAQEVDK